MKKLIVIPLFALTVFAFGCNYTSNDAVGDVGNVVNGSLIEDSEKLTFNSSISSATAIYAECGNKQLNEISVKLKIAHCSDFAYYRNLDVEHSEFNNIAVVRSIYILGENEANSDFLSTEPLSEEIVGRVNDFLSDEYDFYEVKKSSEFVAEDKCGKELSDGAYVLHYDIGVINERGEIDYSKLVWGTDIVDIYVEKSGNSFNLFTGYEWYLKWYK